MELMLMMSALGVSSLGIAGGMVGGIVGGVPGAWLLGELGWVGVAATACLAAGVLALWMHGQRGEMIERNEEAGGLLGPSTARGDSAGGDSAGGMLAGGVLAGATIDVHTIEEVELRVLLLVERGLMDEGDRLLRVEFTVTTSGDRGVGCVGGGDVDKMVYEPMRLRLHACVLASGMVGVGGDAGGNGEGRAEGRAVRMTPIRDDGTPMRELFVDRPQRFEGLFACPGALVGRSVFAYGEVTLGDLFVPGAFEPPTMRAA